MFIARRSDSTKPARYWSARSQMDQDGPPCLRSGAETVAVQQVQEYRSFSAKYKALPGMVRPWTILK